jgi:hypothetical protein
MLRDLFRLRGDGASNGENRCSFRTRAILSYIFRSCDESCVAASCAAAARRVVLIAPAPALFVREIKRNSTGGFYEIPVDSDGGCGIRQFGNSDFVGCLLQRWWMLQSQAELLRESKVSTA